MARKALSPPLEPTRLRRRFTDEFRREAVQMMSTFTPRRPWSGWASPGVQRMWLRWLALGLVMRMMFGIAKSDTPAHRIISEWIECELARRRGSGGTRFRFDPKR